VSAAVKTQLASLAEGLGAAIHTANKGLLVRVRVLVFTKVLWKRKNFAAELTRECLLSTVDVIVPLQGKFSRESFSTHWMLANKNSYGHGGIIS
jgi:hypothetical protein